MSNQICMSLGCPISRKLGFIKDEELVVGIPSRLLDSLLVKEEK